MDVCGASAMRGQVDAGQVLQLTDAVRGRARAEVYARLNSLAIPHGAYFWEEVQAESSLAYRVYLKDLSTEHQFRIYALETERLQRYPSIDFDFMVLPMPGDL
jgi:hypothetical protein